MTDSKFHADNNNRVIQTFIDTDDEQISVWVCKTYSGIDPKKLANALNQREALLKVCKEFIAKVDSGKAKSTDTYNKMKAAIGDNQ